MFGGASAFDQNLCSWKMDFPPHDSFCSGGSSCGTSACQPSQIPTLAPSQATHTYVTGVVALCCIIAFEIIWAIIGHMKFDGRNEQKINLQTNTAKVVSDHGYLVPKNNISFHFDSMIIQLEYILYYTFLIPKKSGIRL